MSIKQEPMEYTELLFCNNCNITFTITHRSFQELQYCPVCSGSASDMIVSTRIIKEVE